MTETSSPSLEPCPVCGGEAQFWHAPHVGGLHDCVVLDAFGVAVECAECGLTTISHMDGKQAASAWNTRTAATDEQFARAVHDGRTWVCVEDALASDVLKPIGGFTRDSVYRETMLEYDGWMEKAEALLRDMWSTLSAMYRIGTGSDVGKERVYEERLREFGIEVDA